MPRGLLYIADDLGEFYPCVGTLDSLPDIDITGLADGYTLIWDATAQTWTVGAGTPAGPTITVSATAPATPAANDLWVDIS